jgi:hypothetical protein
VLHCWIKAFFKIFYLSCSSFAASFFAFSAVQRAFVACASPFFLSLSASAPPWRRPFDEEG